MNWKLIRIIDRWAGIPLLYLLRLFFRMRPPKQIKSSPRPQRILFVKFWGIGNIFMILPSVQAIREQWPDVSVDFLTLENNREALVTSGAVNNIVMISTRSLSRFLATWRHAVAELRRNNYDVIIDCEQFSRFSAIITRQINATVMIGFNTRGQYRHNLFTRQVVYDNDIHITRSFYCLVRAAGIKSPEPPQLRLAILPALLEHGRCLMARFGLDTGQPVALMHIGTSANFQERRWLPDRYAALADRLIACWNAKIIFTGLPEESELIEETLRYLRHSEQTINLGGQLTFMDYFALIAASDLVISADTAAVHLASAANTPVAGLYGPNTPALYGPWGEQGLALYVPQPCSPCITNFNAKIHACRNAAGRGACMAALSVDNVFDALQAGFPELAGSAHQRGKVVRRS
jgi:heptosyltransferase-3